MEIYLQGKKISLKPRQAIGKGGEADVFKLNKTTAVKVFKQPNHPDYQGQPSEQQAARDRLTLHQQKLPHFPQGLPAEVITPQELVRDGGGQIVGYTMRLIGQSEPLLRFSNRRFRHQHQINNQGITEIFIQLHHLISQLHRQGVIIGDFNDLNVLIHQLQPYLIDADSCQFGQFLTPVFTARFIDSPAMRSRRIGTHTRSTLHHRCRLV
ncbi:MAG: hypothetical protein HC796_03240 [Synechococcaceae cyanobacterium RL_1_2]|nr:hypothetical protein [Synechococcaceae cyanobacterium RL_1_2]